MVDGAYQGSIDSGYAESDAEGDLAYFTARDNLDLTITPEGLSLWADNGDPFVAKPEEGILEIASDGSGVRLLDVDAGRAVSRSAQVTLSGSIEC